MLATVAACSSDPPSAPADSETAHFDVDDGTTYREVFDTLAGAEQDCIREDIDDALASVLNRPVLSDDDGTDQFVQSMIQCVEPETTLEFVISAMVAASSWAAEEGSSAGAGEEIRKACLRRLLADVDLTAWLSEAEPAGQTSVDDELLAAVFACGLDPELEMETITTTPDAVSSDEAVFDDHADVPELATYADVGWGVDGAIDHDGDVDYFVFSAEQGRVYEIDVELGTLPDSTVALYDDGSFQLAFNDDYTDNGDHTASRITWQAEYTGDHFVAVESFDNSTGTYYLTVSSDEAVFDDHADVPELATYADVGWGVDGAIDHDGDVDYFVFSAEQGRVYEVVVELGTLPDSTVALYDDGSFQLAFNDDYTDNGDHAGSRITWQAEYTGDHFVAVESFDNSTGTYYLTVSSDEAVFDDHADVPELATYADVGWGVDGAIDHDGDVDYFVFSAEQGRVYEIDVELGTLPDSTVALYDDGSFQLAFNDDYTDNGDHKASRITWQAEYTGGHFVAVESFDNSTGTYYLTIASR